MTTTIKLLSSMLLDTSFLLIPPPPPLCSAGTITVHLQKDSLGHLSLVANPLRENRESFKVSTGPAAVAIWQKLQQASGSGTGTLSQWQHAQLAHALQER